jgi:hypothetical protein
MRPLDLCVLCAALGFTAVVIRGGKAPKEEGARRATEFASFIEEFCRIAVPKAFEQEKEAEMRVVDLIGTGAEGKFGPGERMATAIVEIHREQGGCLPQDLLSKGFTNGIVRHWQMANALAKIELSVMDS